MNILRATVPRILLGLISLVGAINGFSFILSGSHFIHSPTSDRGLAFEAGLQVADGFCLLRKSIELVGALCLLTNKTPVPGLALLSPILTVIGLYHFILNPGGIPFAFILVITGGILVNQYHDNLNTLTQLSAKGET